MAVKSKEEILSSLKALVGDSTSDETLAFIEDVQDTMTDFDTRLADTTDWKAKYEQNDSEWRNKYRERFFSSPEDVPELNPEPDPEPIKRTFDDLFTKEG